MFSLTKRRTSHLHLTHHLLFQPLLVLQHRLRICELGFERRDGRRLLRDRLVALALRSGERFILRNERTEPRFGRLDLALAVRQNLRVVLRRRDEVSACVIVCAVGKKCGLKQSI